MDKSMPVTATQVSRAKATEATDNPRNTGHPLTKHTHQSQSFMDKISGAKEKDEVIVERIEEWYDAVNRIASTKDGQYFIKTMIKFSGIYKPKKGVGAERLLRTEGEQAFYLEFVHPYLNPTNKKELI